MCLFVIPVSALWRNMEHGSKTCLSHIVWLSGEMFDFQDYFSFGYLSDVLVLGSFYIAGWTLKIVSHRKSFFTAGQ